jgi:hypothetical protein
VGFGIFLFISLKLPSLFLYPSSFSKPDFFSEFLDSAVPWLKSLETPLLHLPEIFPDPIVSGVDYFLEGLADNLEACLDNFLEGLADNLEACLDNFLEGLADNLEACLDNFLEGLADNLEACLDSFFEFPPGLLSNEIPSGRVYSRCVSLENSFVPFRGLEPDSFLFCEITEFIIGSRSATDMVWLLRF